MRLFYTQQNTHYDSTLSHQVKVSVLGCPVFGRHLLDMALLYEFVGRVHNVLLSPKPLVDLQQFVHLLLKTPERERVNASQHSHNVQGTSSYIKSYRGHLINAFGNNTIMFNQRVLCFSQTMEKTEKVQTEPHIQQR